MTSQARYWILTIPHADFLPYLPPNCSYIRGQLERAASGFIHWQIVVAFKSKQRLRAVKLTFGNTVHAEPSKSSAADAYVWKDDTAIPTTRFELGSKPHNRANPADWDRIRSAAIEGRLVDIPADVYVRYYGNLKRIAADNLEPTPIERRVFCYWGATGTGKSRRAWTEAGLDAYPKDPRSKFWDGYRGHVNVVIDEFRGDVAIGHLLRWFDRYPVNVEVKGSSTALKAECIWITSNLDPRKWYPDLDEETLAALLRRLTIVHFNEPL